MDLWLELSSSEDHPNTTGIFAIIRVILRGRKDGSKISAGFVTWYS